MACKFICDGCGKEADAVFYPNGSHGWHKPERWFQRSDKDGPQDACCRECIQKTAVKTGKTDVILPI